MRLIFEPFFGLGTYRGLVYQMIALPLGAVYFALVAIELSIGPSRIVTMTNHEVRPTQPVSNTPGSSKQH